MYARDLIDQVVVYTEKDLGEELCGFREDIGFSDRVFVAWKLFEKMK